MRAPLSVCVRHLHKMNDQELPRFAQAAKSMCSPLANSGKPPDSFLIQLREARARMEAAESGPATLRFDLMAQAFRTRT
jgi:hypothetical protein